LKRRSHFRDVGREMPNRRQTAFASPSSWSAAIHFRRCRTARSANPFFPFDEFIAAVMAVGLLATHRVVHHIHSQVSR